MAFVLPADRAGLPALEARLDAATLDSMLSGMAGVRVIVSLPKFTVDPADPLALATALAAMGMPTAFDRLRADFTGIANPPRPDQRLFISHVFHKAFVKVDEEGTEAAAATAVVMAEAGSAAPSEPPPEFRADHPFLFFLRDLRSGAILFAGRVEDPRAR
jgi:serpin B